MIEFREARAEDDEQLTRLIASPLPGDLSLAFCREPSYLTSCARCGPRRRVLTAVQQGQVIALCSFFLRSYHWGGTTHQVWTLSDFRALPQHAGKSITGRGWRAIRQLLEGRPAMISVLRENHRTMRLFSKPRPQWPGLHPIGALCTNITPLWKWPRLLAARDPQASLVRQLSPEQVLSFANDRREPLSPRIGAEDFGTVLPPMDRFWGVFSTRGELLGAAGLSEPRAHRQVKISSYGGFYARLHRWSRVLGVPLLPDPGSQVALSTACLLNCSAPGPFRSLFARLKVEARKAGSSFLVWCKGGTDFTSVWDRLRFRYHSRLYQLLWEGDRPLPALPSPLGYEVAWL